MKSITSLVIVWMGVPFITTNLLIAQEPDLTLQADVGNSEFGSAFSLAGDINDDGVPDVAIADRSANVEGVAASGVVYVVNGLDGEVLRTLTGDPASAQYFGMSLATLDANEDGVVDLAVGSPGKADVLGYGAGAVTVFSGVDGSVLASAVGASRTNFGSVMANAGDQDGDGVEDLFVSAPYANSYKGEVLTLSGKDLSVLRRVTTSASSTSFGYALAALDDSDGDGRKELVVASPGFTGTTDYGVGRVQLIRSSDGAVSAEIQGAGFFNRLGNSLATAADIDGDGSRELLVGSYWHGTLKLVSGVDLTTVQDLSLTLPADSPIHVGGSMDFDGDGEVDTLIGSPGLGIYNDKVVGGVRIISGADQSVLLERLATAQYTGLGQVQAVLPGLGFAVGESRLHDATTGGYGAAYLWQVDLVKDSDGDGIPDDSDANPDSVMDPTVVILGLDSGVANFVDDNGITLADRFANLGTLKDYGNDTLYFTAVVHLANELIDQGALDQSERKAINAAARDQAVQSNGKKVR